MIIITYSRIVLLPIATFRCYDLLLFLIQTITDISSLVHRYFANVKRYCVFTCVDTLYILYQMDYFSRSIQCSDFIRVIVYTVYANE